MPKAIIRYAGNAEARLAYQVVGQGALDLVLVPGFPANLEILWEDPGYSRLIKRLLTFCRVILFDKRGSGLSDGVDAAALPDLATRIGDIAAVMDAAGCGRAVLLGASDGAALAIGFAAAHGARVRALVLHGGFAHDSHDGKRMRGQVEESVATWGTGASLARLAPGRGDDRAFAEWWGRLERLSASPSAAHSMARMRSAVDVRDALPAISAPTLVLHRTRDTHVPVESGRDLARAIKEARLVELPGRDHPIWIGDVDGVADRIEEFLTGERRVNHSDRVLAALLVARVIGPATGPAAAGVRHLDERIELFRDAIPKVMAGHGGDARWSGPDRIDARFNGAARAAGCAIAVRDMAASLGLALAQGIHIGEIDLPFDALSGGALDVAARIAGSTRRPEILLSRLARDLVSGSGLQFADRGVLTPEGAGEPLAIVALASERHLEPVMSGAAATADLDRLSPREREVLALVADGLSNPRIALQLGLSEHTVKRHVANILLKLDVPTRAAMAGLAARQSAQ